MFSVTIDDQPYQFADTLSILDALTSLGLSVPHLCHDARLTPSGACRLCVVEVQGQQLPVASCSTPLQDGMQIRTHSDALQSLRRTNLSLLAAHYPATAMSQDPKHPFHQLLNEYGITPNNSFENIDDEHTCFQDLTHPYIGVDLSRCIHCQRCVRICDEVQGQFVWQVWQRGEQIHLATNDHQSLISSGCTSCGACVDTCPSGALFDKAHDAQNLNGANNSEPIAASTWTRSTCVYCGVGCQLDIASHDQKVIAIRPAPSPVNHAHLCVKGRYAHAFNHAPDRITEPMLRDGAQWRMVSWDEAFDFTAQKLQAIIARDGANVVGVLGSARATNEDNYLAQKFARVVMGTNNVDCCARVCHAPSAKALKTMLGTGAATNSFDDIEAAELFLIAGCNPTENHPIVGARIKQAVRAGAKLIVIDPRRIELADYADIHLALTPGSNVALFNAMACCMVEEQLINTEYVTQRVAGLSDFVAHIKNYSPEKMAPICAVAANDIRAAARLYATHQRAMSFHGLGLTEHSQGTEAVMCLINLALLCGHIGQAGSGINPLRGQNNVQGSAQMGCEPASLTGAQDIEQARAKFEALWQHRLPHEKGLNLMAMIDAARAGQFKALWAIGFDVYQTLANQTETAAALQQLELLIVQDLFMTETARAFAQVFFPAASVFERDGTFMNSDRRVQRVRATVAAPGSAKPDAWIIQQLAQRMGFKTGFEFETAEAIWNEVRQLWPAAGGLSYTRLQTTSLQWPCPDETHPGTPILHREQFARGKPATLACIDFVPSREQCDEHYPLLLNSGRHLYHFNAGTMTYRTDNQMLRVSDTLDMHPYDAQGLDLHDNDSVRVSSRYGSVLLPLKITDRVTRGELFCSFHKPELMINRLTSNERDKATGAPEYKRTAVRVEKAE